MSAVYCLYFKLTVVILLLSISVLSLVMSSSSSSFSTKTTDIDIDKIVKSKSHLIVLSHGLMGFAYDLTTLSQLLNQDNIHCTILQSKTNEFQKSLRSIEILASSLVSEIIDHIKTLEKENQSIECISFVGNSLGGIIARYAIKELFADPEFISRNIMPYKFLTIATPHLGVFHYNMLESNNIRFPGDTFIKTAIARLMATSVTQLMASDNTSLLYKMATSEEYLAPLRRFKERRLYSNLKRDSVVPLGTAAFLPKAQVQLLRNKFHSHSGFVFSINTSRTSSTAAAAVACENVESQKDDKNSIKLCNNSQQFSDSNQLLQSLPSSAIAGEAYLIDMISSLDSIGWQKFVVNFPGWVPLAHNKLCALKRRPQWLYDDLLGFNQGHFVMEHAATWLSS